MLTKKKKIFMLAGMVLLLAVTVWLNVLLAANADNKDQDVLAGSFFAEFRAERQSTRNEEIVLLDSVINSTASEYEQARATAMEQKTKIITIMDQEFNIEKILKAKGYEDVGVTISVATNKINVIVKAPNGLTSQDTVKIYDVLYDQIQADANDVTITPLP